MNKIFLITLLFFKHTEAYARRGGSSDGSGLLTIIIIGVIIFVIVWFYSDRSNKAKIEAEHIRKSMTIKEL